MAFFVFPKAGKGGAKAGFRVMFKYFEIKKSFISNSLSRYYIKQIDFMLPCVCSVKDHRRRQNVVRTSVTHSNIASCATFFLTIFWRHLHVIYYWTDARQHGTYLLNIALNTVKSSVINWTKKRFFLIATLCNKITLWKPDWQLL